MDSTSKARELRRNSTETERVLWRQLRGRELAGYKFDRQVPIEPYIADFVCRSRKLVIELDGGQHKQQRVEDEQRTRWFNSKGYRVLRFWNSEVLTNMAGVLEKIRAELA